MRFKLIQLHHKSRGRPPTRAKSREGPADLEFMIYDSRFEIPETRNRFGYWKCRTTSSQVEDCFDELQYTNTVAGRRLPDGMPGRNALGLRFYDFNIRLARKSRIRKYESGIPLARDWVIFTCRGNTKAKPDRHNQIAVINRMNYST